MDKTEHPILKKYEELLRRISDVVDIYESENEGFFIEEQQDNWYRHKLTKEDCIELSKLFEEIAREINKYLVIFENNYNYDTIQEYFEGVNELDARQSAEKWSEQTKSGYWKIRDIKKV